MMRSTTVTILLFLICGLTIGQNLTVSLPTITATPGQIVFIPVKLTGAGSTGVPISGANIQLTYDTAVLQYETITNFYTSMPQSQWFFAGQNGLVSANWLEPSLNTLAVPDNTTLYEIKFTYKGGNSALTYTVTEFTDAAYNLIPTTPVNGAVNAPVVYRQVTFKVDMSKENISSSGVQLAGSFNNWSYTQNPMLLGPNSVYSTTISLQEGTTYQYRFVNGTVASGLETVPSSCGVVNGSGQYDRQITIPAHDTAYPAVCFSRCSHCPASVNVTFRVDMQHQTPSSSGVHVSGTFNNWNYAQNLMTASGGSIYETSMIMEEGTYTEYKFVNGITAQDAETVPSACAVGGNRFITIPAHDTVLTAFCYDSCTACGTVAHYSQVTFRVDLRAQLQISPDGVHIAGTFQGWNPGSTPMTVLTDSIFTYTESLLAGTSIQYKFVNGNTAAGYESVPFACASNDNRTLLVPEEDIILNTICFSGCDTCVIIGLPEYGVSDAALLQNFPNPGSELTRIGYIIPERGTLQLTVYNSMGQLVSLLVDGPCTPGTYTRELQCAGLPQGVYSYRMVFSGQKRTFIANKKMIVN